jgi:acetyl-CoA carboxylase biotin carboxyl carrier protein
MDAEKLKKFIKFMDDNNLCELEIEEEGKRIRLRKYAQEQAVVTPQTIAQKETAPTQAPQEKGLGRGVEIKSPMVGTFYRAPSPGAKPYIEVHDTIKPGDVVCIIEAMKLMNEIKAEVGGKITAIHVENGEPIEFDQPLFLIEPA